MLLIACYDLHVVAAYRMTQYLEAFLVEILLGLHYSLRLSPSASVAILVLQ
jgi:hypothetical protein